MNTLYFQHNQFLVALGSIDESNFTEFLAIGEEL